jgi:FixJ family two-component response regulator
VLVVDDELGVRESLRLILKDEFEVLEAADGAAAMAIVEARRIDVALLDVRMPGESGPALLPRILGIGEHIAVILMTAMPQVRTAVEAIKAGAYDYVIKPFEPDEILLLVRQAAQHRMLEREVRYLRCEFDLAHGFDQLVGRHARMVRLYEMIAQVAATHATVLITAESGTGKELARDPPPEPAPRPALHRRQSRRHSRHADRVRAVRSREGRVHGRLRAQAGQVRARAQRHAVPRRGGQLAHRPAGEALARAARA